MKYNRALIFCPKRYSIASVFKNTLGLISEEVDLLDVSEAISPFAIRMQAQTFRFPYKIRNRFDTNFFSKMNKIILEKYNATKPDLVFIYNSEYLLPETCEKLKKRSKLIFFMGDSPFYTPANNNYLSLLQYADLILAPDSFWLHQLNLMGISKTSFFVPSIDSGSYYFVDNDKIEKSIEETEVLYAGSSYVNSWGYKKAMLMDQFSDINFKLYGTSTWRRWFNYFPDLEKNFIQSNYIETQRLNKMFNKAKLIPVDGNPGLINGMHIRVLEVLGSGTLPLIEFKKDFQEIIFKDFGSEIPVFQNYKNAKDMAQYYLKNDKERKDLASKMKIFISDKYSLQNNAALIAGKLTEFQK
jgi:hypothetical protein